MAVVGSTSVTTILTGGLNDRTVWIDLAVTGTTAALTWWKANTPSQPWAKLVVALLGAGALAFAFAWTDHAITPDEVPAILLAVLGALQVGAVANTQK
jgi:hypothetical protein